MYSVEDYTPSLKIGEYPSELHDEHEPPEDAPVATPPAEDYDRYYDLDDDDDFFLKEWDDEF